MSHDISLCDPDTGEVLPTEHFAEGGARNLYGTNGCELNVTYNYYSVFRMADFAIKDLNGRRAQETLPELRRVREALGGDLERPPQPWSDYWAPTPGNALVVINRLIAFAKDHPSGVWQVA